MFHTYSQKIADKLIASDIISLDKRNIYVYGLELLLSSFVGILALAVVSLIVKVPLLWMPYLAGFIPLRLTGGGYHAKSHRACILTFTAAYILSMLLIKYVSFSQIAIVLSASAAFVITLAFSPVEAHNKPLSNERKKDNRKRSIILGLCNIVLAMLAVFFHFAQAPFILSYFIGNAAAAISMVVVVIINIWKRRRIL